MVRFGFAAFALAALSVARADAAPSGLTVAEDIVDVSARVCFPVATGALSFTPIDVSAEMRTIAALGLSYGIPSPVIDSLGQAGQTLVSRATIASRPNGDYHVLLAIGGALPGCRVMLAGAIDPSIPDAVAQALVAPDGGWTALPGNRVSGFATRRSFVRRGPNGRAYLLDLIAIDNPAGTLRIVAMIGDVPPDGVPLPPGF